MFDESYWNVDLTEFNKLAKMLECANIPHTNERMGFSLGNGRQIRLYNDAGEQLADVICHYGSYGWKEGLLEIMGALTAEENEYDDVLGWLTAEEVFKRFKYCYEHNTRIYVREDKNETQS